MEPITLDGFNRLCICGALGVVVAIGWLVIDFFTYEQEWLGW